MPAGSVETAGLPVLAALVKASALGTGLSTDLMLKMVNFGILARSPWCSSREGTAAINIESQLTPVSQVASSAQPFIPFGYLSQNRSA